MAVNPKPFMNCSLNSLKAGYIGVIKWILGVKTIAHMALNPKPKTQP